VYLRDGRVRRLRLGPRGLGLPASPPDVNVPVPFPNPKVKGVLPPFGRYTLPPVEPPPVEPRDLEDGLWSVRVDGNPTGRATRVHRYAALTAAHVLWNNGAPFPVPLGDIRLHGFVTPVALCFPDGWKAGPSEHNFFDYAFALFRDEASEASYPPWKLTGAPESAPSHVDLHYRTLAGDHIVADCGSAYYSLDETTISKVLLYAAECVESPDLGEMIEEGWSGSAVSAHGVTGQLWGCHAGSIGDKRWGRVFTQKGVQNWMDVIDDVLADYG
jgi:hypothetical protein